MGIDLAVLWTAPKPKARYVYRERFYPEPHDDWPAPKEPCIHCKLQMWPASWKWNGYHWQCTRRHDDT